MNFDRAASAAIVQRRAARRWYLDAHEAATCMLATRDVPAGTWDSAALPPPAKARPSKAPRHRALVRDLAGLRMWRDLQQDLDDGTWLVGDNDNSPDPDSAPAWASRQTEAELDMRPSEEQMLAAARGAEPVRDGDFVTLGNLRFHRGRLTGWRTPDGEWRRPSEIYGVRRGTAAGATGSDAAIRRRMAIAGEWQDLGGRREPALGPLSNGLGYIRRDWLAVSGWRNHPAGRPEYRPALDTPVTPCTGPALPTLGRLSEQFLGFRVRPSCTAGDAPTQAASTIESRMTRAAEEAASARLPRCDKRVLRSAMAARTMEGLGNVIGFSGKRAKREGKSALIAAAKNLEEILLAA